MKTELEDIHHRVSRRQYTELDLEDGEFVVLDLKRSKVGYILIWTLLIFFFILLTFGAVAFVSRESFYLNDTVLNGSIRIGFLIAIFTLYPVSFLFALMVHSVYKRNRMYITNRRVIQDVVKSPFSKSRNIIDLTSIEDVSYHKKGILQYILHFGTLRMATVGDETTYTFTFLDTPDDEVDTISHLMRKAKNKKENSR